MFFALFFAAPFMVFVALFLAAFLHRRGPTGVGYAAWVLIVWLGGMAAISSYVTIEFLAIDAARTQHRFLGRQYAGVLQLRRYQSFVFPDPAQMWDYRIDPAVAARLRTRCLTIEGAPPGDCCLYYREEGNLSEAAVLRGDELHIEWVTT